MGCQVGWEGWGSEGRVEGELTLGEGAGPQEGGERLGGSVQTASWCRRPSGLWGPRDGGSASQAALQLGL